MENQHQTPQKEEIRKRGSKLFPVLSFSNALILAEGIYKHGVGSQIRRLTLFDKLEKSPNSGASRTLISTSNKYGLTIGGYQADYLSITDDGNKYFAEDSSNRERQQIRFQLSIEKQDIFQQLYDRLKNKRLPSNDVIRDELINLNIPKEDIKNAIDVFLQNIRDLDLIREISGKETILTIEQVLEESPSDKNKSTKKDLEKNSIKDVDTNTDSEKNEKPNRLEPSVHIDIQIHIDSTASLDQIDQIFASMARHIYQKGVI
jgi:hypothetical protein